MSFAVAQSSPFGGGVSQRLTAEERLAEKAPSASLRSAPPPKGEDLKAAAKQFEAIFLRQMIASMRSPSLGDDLFGSDAGNQFRDMADARLADTMAGKFGIAKMLEKQLAR
jgi:peptidoglycan hydrolase FlgJ